MKTALLARTPFRESEYFKRFADGRLTVPQVWAHISNQFLLVSWFPRIFSGIHSRCDELEVRKDLPWNAALCATAFYESQVGD